VVTHVVGAREAQPRRKPSVHVDAPVDFLSGNEVGRPTYEYTGRDPESEYEVKGNYHNPIARKKQRDMKRTATERHVLRLAGCPNIHVVIEVSSAE
jgi:hypothetical protein